MHDFEKSEEKIKILVEQYNEYMELEKQIQDLKEKLKKSSDLDISKQITLLQLKQKYL
jgi:protein subunit release factor A